MLKNEIVILEPADPQNVNLLVRWTLDPVAQGPYKRVPSKTAAELQNLFLHTSDRQYFLIRRTIDQKPLGRFYWRAWRFGSSSEMIDWELNIEPGEVHTFIESTEDYFHFVLHCPPIQGDKVVIPQGAPH